MNKQTAIKIEKAGRAALLEAGAVETPLCWHEYTKDSRAGTVELSIRRTTFRRGWTVGVFAAFDDPKQAKAVGIDCNPFTGKYNFHGIESVDEMEQVIHQYRQEGEE